jgi:hypothetical protein
MLPEVMHESWIENIEQVIDHILFKNSTKIHFLESQLLSTCLEFEIGRKNLFRTSTYMYKFNRIGCML